MYEETEITLYPEQQRAFELLSQNRNSYFVTGKAGTGKSVLLRYFVSHTPKKVAIVASTGIAALNVSGQTVNSFFGINFKVQNPSDEKQTSLSQSKANLLHELEVLVIDEISMVRVDVMDMIDAKLRLAKGTPLTPFGGCQIICFGDLYQLPPVVKDREIEKYLQDQYHTVFFYGAPGWRQAGLTIIELNDVHRQKDIDFIEVLNGVREGNVSDDLLQKLNKRCKEVPLSSGCITLAPTNKVADDVNEKKLGEIEGEEKIYRGEFTGSYCEDDGPTQLELKLKVGAQVMFLRNDKNKRWVNGSIGTVSLLEDELIKIRIDGIDYPINKEIWEKYEYKYDCITKSIKQDKVGTFSQYPIKLAYASTIHKSQGQTYDSINVDYSKGSAFEAGQTYVALSRCRSMEGLYLGKKLCRNDICVNQEILDFMHLNKSNDRNVRFQNTSPVLLNQSKAQIANFPDDIENNQPNRSKYAVFLHALERDPLIHRQTYLSTLKEIGYPKCIEPLLLAIQGIVDEYREFYWRNLEMKRKNEINKDKCKSLLQKQHVIFCESINGVKDVIRQILLKQ